VVLCADDFAQTPETVEGILALVDTGRLSAVSCLVESPLWADAGVRLRSRPSDFDIGLHFNLTHDFAGAGHRPGALPLTTLAACARLLSRGRIELRLHRQFDLFEDMIGRPPDFVDGHQHVHQLPLVRDALVAVLRSRYPSSPIAVRVTVPARLHGLKERLIAGLGGRGLLETARREGIPHNADFAGLYDFSPFPAFGDRFSDWLADLRDGGLILCHPARAGAAAGDPIARARSRELDYFQSDAFLPALRQRRVRLTRFRDLAVQREGT
jgi:predicted glycoside hydrolase/deacetylase ChbG (UPF0249 family)